MTMDTRWENVDTLLDRTERTKDEGVIKAIQEVAATRYGFPTVDHPSYRTHVNVPEVSMAVQVGDEQIAPDIVVVEKLKTGETHLTMTAAVATRELVNEGEAKRSWARYASIPNSVFYLYVPVGYGVAAKRICKKLKIKVGGYRTWRWTPRGFEVNDVSEPMSGFAPLMPPIVRKLLATR
ncbi:MAG: hypothetical protein HY873_03595 [Chloroflexi bacterium]|nr:hypothetical protein [Chloroflexota bacterium]